MRHLVATLLACAAIGAGGFWVITRPAALPDAVAAGHTPDVDNGAQVFAAAGCASCHAAPGSEDKTALSGGHPVESAFGTFYAPNISPSDQGLSGWSLAEFSRALRQGIGRSGEYLYPAFPYTTYTGMTDTDVSDLFTYLGTLPADATPNRAHDIGFPVTIRRGIGLWTKLYLDPAPVMTGDLSPELERGRYLVEALSHCAECHTPRTVLGGLDRAQWMAGAANPSGKGRIPNITPSELDWSQEEIAEYLTSGFTPDYDSVGGTMAKVVGNISQLPQADRMAIAAYVKALPAR